MCISDCVGVCENVWQTTETAKTRRKTILVFPGAKRIFYCLTTSQLDGFHVENLRSNGNALLPDLCHSAVIYFAIDENRMFTLVC